MIYLIEYPIFDIEEVGYDKTNQNWGKSKAGNEGIEPKTHKKSLEKKN